MGVHPLKRYRDANGMTQVQLALWLGVTGVTVSRWETGRRSPRRKELQEIAAKTGIHPAELLGFLPRENEAA